MSKIDKMEVLFQELCDEDIAGVSGGLLTSASAIASNNPTQTTASVMVTGADGSTKSLTVTSPTVSAVTQPTSTTSTNIPTFLANLVNAKIISILDSTV